MNVFRGDTIVNKKVHILISLYLQNMQKDVKYHASVLNVSTLTLAAVLVMTSKYYHSTGKGVDTVEVITIMNHILTG